MRLYVAVVVVMVVVDVVGVTNVYMYACHTYCSTKHRCALPFKRNCGCDRMPFDAFVCVDVSVRLFALTRTHVLFGYITRNSERSTLFPWINNIADKII